MFIFDVEARKVVYQKHLLDTDYSGKHVWRDAFFVNHPAGQVYGTSGGKLFRINPATKEIAILRDGGANLLCMDGQGRLYFADKTHLWQYMVDGPRAN